MNADRHSGVCDTLTREPRFSTVAGERVLESAVVHYTAALGERAVAIYALGSLAHGGFRPAVSDVDVGVVLDRRQPGDEVLVDRVRHILQSSGLALAERLSVFWSSHGALRRGREDGRFPAADRLDLIDHGRLLHGHGIGPLLRPSTAELIVDGARSALLRLADEQTRTEIRQPELLMEDLVRFTKIVLMPVRLHYTGETGKLGLTDTAVRYHVADGDAPGRGLVHAAQAVRNGDRLERHVILELARRELIDLYRWYVDGELRRLAVLGAEARAMIPDFRQWLDELPLPRGR